MAVVAASCLGIQGAWGVPTSSWDGGGADNKWSTPENWGNNTLPANNGTVVISLGDAAVTDINVDSEQSVLHLLFSTTKSYTLSGSTITIYGYTASGPASADNTVGINAYSGVMTINNQIKLQNAQTIKTSTGSTLILNGSINANGQSMRILTNAANSVMQINGGITGTVVGQLGFNGSGTTYINSASTYVGATSIFSGTVVMNTDVGQNSGGFGSAGSADSTIKMGVNGSGLSPTLLIAGSHTFARDVQLITNNGGSSTFKIGGSTADISTFSGNVIMGNNNYNAQALTLTASSGGRLIVTGNLVRASGATGSSDGVTKSGAGTVVLAGSGNNYSGTTSVSAGTLLVNGVLSSGGGTVSVAANATLGGTGTINRAVSLADNATLASGDGGIGKLTLASLSLSNGSLLNMEVSGGNSDQIIVGGDLVLDGVLNITGAVAPGTYTLMTYTGQLTDHGLTLGTVPEGVTLTIDTSTAGKINLVAVPEPATGGFVLSGSACAVALLKRKR